jgi:hypothetical protein
MASRTRPPLAPLERMALAFCHPHRVSVLHSFSSGAKSISLVAEATGLSVKVAAYHTNVLHKDAGLLELTNTLMEGRNVQRIYRLKAPSALQLSTLPLGVRAIAEAPLLDQIFGAFQAALSRGGLDTGGIVLGQPLTFDPEGFSEAEAAVRSSFNSIDRISAESRERLDTGTPHTEMACIAGAALVEAT